MSTTKIPPRTNHIVLSIDGNDYLLPSAADLPTILNALAGIRRVRTEYHYRTERRVLIDHGESEFSVGAMIRELVTPEQNQELAELERKSREESK